MKYRNTERAEFGYVRELSNGGMNEAKSSERGMRKEPVKKRADQLSGLFAAEIMSGKRGNKDADEDGRNPVGGSRPGRCGTIHRRVRSAHGALVRRSENSDQD